MRPDLEHWLPHPALRIAHRRSSRAPADELWSAARAVEVTDTALLGRLVRWRIPGTTDQHRFDELFRNPPFVVLAEADQALVSGIVGRIWTLRRDYPQIDAPDEFRSWAARGTARVVFGNWVEEGADGSWLCAEARAQPFGVEGRVGLAAVRPLVTAFQHLIGSDGIEAAVRRAEGRRP